MLFTIAPKPCICTITKKMRVEVAYAEPSEQVIIALNLVSGATARDAITQSGILQRFPNIDIHQQAIGIFGKICKLDQILQEGSRVEIYRPLIADAKQARRNRAAKQRPI